MFGGIRTIKPTFITGFLGLLYAIVVQFTRPFLSDHRNITGNVVQYEESNCPGKYRKKCLFVHLQSESKPFYNPFPGTYKRFLNDEFLNREITLWYDSKREIHQIQNGSMIIIKYHWFLSWNLIMVVVLMFFHFFSFYLFRKSSLNINTYMDMWEYMFDIKRPIMKHNYRTYDPYDKLNAPWYDAIFISKSKHEGLLKDRIALWKRTFVIIKEHVLKEPVRIWMNGFSTGKEFLEAFSLFDTIINGKASNDKKYETTNEIFDFLSIRLEFGREKYDALGKLFKENFPEEYARIISQLDRVR